MHRGSKFRRSVAAKWNPPQMGKSDDTVAAARRLLAERRRALIKSLGFAQQDEQLEAHMDLIVRIQAVIDVLDRIAREETLAP
jgi:hypothetical protein